jgi:hypothetical protein
MAKTGCDGKPETEVALTDAVDLGALVWGRIDCVDWPKTAPERD